MSAVKWVKIETSIITNRKLLELRESKNGNDKVLLWFYLIILAGRCNDNGRVYFAPEVPYDDVKLQRELHISKVTIRSGLDYFRTNAMIELDSKGIITLIGWNEYQNAEALERQRELGKIRQQNWRDKVKQNNANHNANITPVNRYNNALEVDVDVDVDKEEDKENIPSLNERKKEVKEETRPVGWTELKKAMSSPNYQLLRNYRSFHDLHYASFAGAISKMSESEMVRLQEIFQNADETQESVEKTIKKVREFIHPKGDN